MTRGPRRTRIVDAALAEFGRRHYRIIVVWQLLGSAAPLLLAVAAVTAVVLGGIWVTHHFDVSSPEAPAPAAPAPETAETKSGDGFDFGFDLDWTTFAAALAAAAVVVAALSAAAWYSPGVFRTAGRKILAVLAAAGGAVLIFLWKGAT